MSISFLHVLSSFIHRAAPIIILCVIAVSIIYGYLYFKASAGAKAVYKKEMITDGVIVVIAILLWVAIGFLESVVGVGQGGRAPIPRMDTQGELGYGNYYNGYYNNYSNNGTVTDTREFLKKSFSASLRTRKVETVAAKVDDLIRDSDGRIDNSTISTKSATFDFVIPKSELEDFEEELRTYTLAKFYSQTISSQNLLNEKQNLERSEDTANKNVATITAQKETAKKDYIARSTPLKSNISTQTVERDRLTARITEIDRLLSTETDQATISALRAERYEVDQKENALTSDIVAITAQLNSLSKQYTDLLADLGVSLEGQKAELALLGEKEDNFFDSIETVQGSIYIRHISLLEAFTLFSPIHPLLLLLVAAVLTRVYFVRKKVIMASVATV
jgi:hypothetical protein